MFVLLKVLLFFFHPLVWVILFFLIALFSRKEKRKTIFYRLGVIALLFFSNPFIIRALVSWYEADPVVPSATGQNNAGIVLGGFVSYNKKDNQGYFNAASDRFIQTALLYKSGHINKIIVAAGNGYLTQHDFREAHFIRDHFKTLGIPEEDILTDAASRNTLENARNSKKIIDSVQLAPPYLLITSALHMPRALQVFRKNGMDAKPFPCDFSSKGVSNNLIEDYILPSSEALQLWDNFIKEIVGRLTYRIMG